MLSLLLVLIGPPVVEPDATRLPESRDCYTIVRTRGGVSQPIGSTWQTIERSESDGRSVLLVTVHQVLGNGAFDMRDDFVLDATTLRPVSLINRRNGEIHVDLSYDGDHIRGMRTTSGQSSPIDVIVPTPVWEGNLFGLTFAALPLTEGADFTVPYWQYDGGQGSFQVRVVGSEFVETPSGLEEAWSVVASARSGSEMTYLISKSSNRELGYRSEHGSQFLGGDCSAVNAIRRDPE